MSSPDETPQKAIPDLTILTDNIPYQHQTDLINKLKIAINPLFNDEVAARLIRIEIDKRKKEGTWDYDDPDQPLD